MPENTQDGTEIDSLKRAVGERKGIDLAHDVEAPPPDPELVERARRRRFTAEYKLRILREADACSKPGEIGALLRREGLYSSLLTEWRRQRERGSLAALDRPRGRRRPHHDHRNPAGLSRAWRGAGDDLPPPAATRAAAGTSAGAVAAGAVTARA